MRRLPLWQSIAGLIAFLQILALALLASCSSPTEKPSDPAAPAADDARFAPGGGKLAPRALALSAGTLVSEEEPSASEGQVLADSETLDSVALDPAERPAERSDFEVPVGPRTGGEAESGFDSEEWGDAAEAQGGLAGSGPQQWQRAGDAPTVARVYIGDGNALALERLRITVTVEGPRARTVVDHVFRNPHEEQLEGSFEYALPTGATPAYYAMFLTGEQESIPEFFPPGAIEGLPGGHPAALEPRAAARIADAEQWGELREARVVGRDRGRQVYEEIVRRSIDPALLEYAGGNTFRGRVFPIQPLGLNRVLFAYEEHLDVIDGQVQYRLPLPDVDLDLLHVSVLLPEALAASASVSMADNPASGERPPIDGRTVYEAAWEQAKGPGGDLRVSYRPEDPRIQAIAGPDPTSEQQVFYARFRPELPAEIAAPWARQAVFVLDTSRSEAPDRFNANAAILQEILAQDASIERFRVLGFDVGAAWIGGDGWLANDAAGRAKAAAAIADVLLEGATDLGNAVDLLGRTDLGGRAPTYLFLLSDGEVNWGEGDPQRLARDLENCASLDARVYCYRTGLSAENLELFTALTRRGGAIFNVFGEQQLAAAARAHRSPALLVDSVEVRAKGAVRDVLVAGRNAAIPPGGEMIVAGRGGDLEGAELLVRGRFAGEAKEFRVALAAATDGGLAPRAWAEIAVQQLLALHDPAVEPLATAYAQKFHLASRVTSFLVLEKDDDYVEFGIEEASQQLAVPGDIGRYLDDLYAGRGEPTARKAVFEAFVRTRLGRPFTEDPHVMGLLAAMDEDDFALPPALRGPVLDRDAASAAYIADVAKDPRAAAPYLTEADRRFDAGEPFAGMRALSTLAEVNPGRSDALRLVGYRLLAFDQKGPAAQLFDRVRDQRPFEPHSYRDLARALERSGRVALAALCYEIVLAGEWHSRFESLKTVVRGEYAQLLRGVAAAPGQRPALASHFAARREEFGGDGQRARLEVVASWNTDATDVDLWIVEPSGEACGYSNPETASGGRLLDDLTGGYGPERYRNVDAPAGEYAVLVHYFSTNPNLIAGETHVDVVVTLDAGTPEAVSRRFTAVLTEGDEANEVCLIRLN